MSSASYAIGVDFGTESGRAVLLDLDSGEELAVGVVRYPDGVIDRELPGSDVKLDADWALQNPNDWVTVLKEAIPQVIAEADVDPARVVGLGVDVTSCTVLPADGEGTPLCNHENLRSRPHAWPKLWKHHAAQPMADRLTEVALERDEDFITRYGGRISSEWYFPKLIEIWCEDREIYDETHSFIEATDWIVWWLTGSECRQTCTAGYKALWSPSDGLPSAAYFEAAYPEFDTPGAKLGNTFVPLGTRAGTLRPDAAREIGLTEATAVAVGNVDSFVSVPGAGVKSPNTFVMVIGTSICDMIVNSREVRLPGITGVVPEGILPGLYGYEAGQPAVGDMLAWYVNTFAPGEDSYGKLEKQAAELRPGENGLVALDWWNGNRSILADAHLSGALFGLTLRTTEAEIYRALLESIAYGNRRVMENFEEHGLELSEIVACGGIAERSPLTMQLTADISGRPVHVPASTEVPARGSALFGAVAAGKFADITEAVEALSPGTARTYEPDGAAHSTYDEVYAIYRSLYETLGRSQVELLHGLKRIRRNG